MADLKPGAGLLKDKGDRCWDCALGGAQAGGHVPAGARLCGDSRVKRLGRGTGALAGHIDCPVTAIAQDDVSRRHLLSARDSLAIPYKRSRQSQRPLAPCPRLLFHTPCPLLLGLYIFIFAPWSGLPTGPVSRAASLETLCERWGGGDACIPLQTA